MKKIIPLCSKNALLAVIAAMAFTIQAGGAAAAASGSPAAPAAQATAADNAPLSDTINHYEALLGKGMLPEAAAYLKLHIAGVPAYQAMILVLHLENATVKSLPVMERRIGSPSVQAAIGKLYKYGDSFADIMARTKDKSLKGLLESAADSGYKLETAEGFYFPVVDYASFKPYRPYVTADIKAYIDIMTVESDQASLKDASLMIGYQQLVNRALSQESFLKLYPTSNRAAKVKALFDKYRTLTFYGINNTPLFDYDTKTMQPNAKKGYSLMLMWHDPSSSGYLTLLQKFMAAAKDNGFKLTAELEKFRKANIPNG